MKDDLIRRADALDAIRRYSTECGSVIGHHSGAIDCAMQDIENLEGIAPSRIVELMNADTEGRLKIVPRAPKGTVCGSCVHFDRETGTAHGFCKTQTQMRVSAEFPSGKIELRYVMQSRPACKGYEPLEEDDDGATD